MNGGPGEISAINATSSFSIVTLPYLAFIYLESRMTQEDAGEKGLVGQLGGNEDCVHFYTNLPVKEGDR
jgi:hypothetical protein